jgi:hypothetical protein
MNVPGNPIGNWDWRFGSRALDARLCARLSELTATYSRWNGEIPEAYRPPRREADEAPLSDARKPAPEEL